MCQRAIGRLTFCEMLGQCGSEELAACGKFHCGNVLVLRMKSEFLTVKISLLGFTISS